MRHRYFTADVFTSRQFGGNPLAVFPDAPALDAVQMQAIARELNLSETVFVFPPEQPAHARRLRIFTPARELPFAGHPTVGTAIVLASIGELDLPQGESEIVLEEGVGPVSVRVRRDGDRYDWAELTAAQAPEERRAEASIVELAAMLGLPAGAIRNDEFAPVAASCGLPFTLVVLKNLSALESIRVDASLILKRMQGAWAPDLFVAAPAESGQWRARMFAPVDQIAEDPATGSACAAFAGFLARRDTSAASDLSWTIRQGVEMGRPSTLKVYASRRDGKICAVRVRGQAVLVAEANMLIAD